MVKFFRSVIKDASLISASVMAKPVQPETWKNQNPGLKLIFLKLNTFSLISVMNEVTKFKRKFIMSLTINPYL
jgi:hypothetical protein